MKFINFFLLLTIFGTIGIHACDLLKKNNALIEISVLKFKKTFPKKCSLESKDREGNTPLLILSQTKENEELLQKINYLFEIGVNANQKNSYKKTALEYSIEFENIELFKLLLNQNDFVYSKEFDLAKLELLIKTSGTSEFTEHFKLFKRNHSYFQKIFPTIVQEIDDKLEGYYINSENFSVVYGKIKDETLQFTLVNHGLLPKSENRIGDTITIIPIAKKPILKGKISAHLNDTIEFFSIRRLENNQLVIYYDSEKISLIENKKYKFFHKLKFSNLSLQNDSILNKIKDKKFCVAFSVGGPEGLVHIGGTFALDLLELKPDCVFGTSMGSIIGGLYAFKGNSIETYKTTRMFIEKYIHETEKIHKKNLIIGSLFGAIICPWCSVVGGVTGMATTNNLEFDRFINILDDVTEKVHIEDMEIPFATMSYEVKDKTNKKNKLKYEYYGKGNFSEAVKGSIANPLIFKNINTDEKLDPGVDRSAVVPIQDTFDYFHADLVLAFNASGKEPYYFSEINNRLKIVTLIGPKETFDVEKIFKEEKYFRFIVLKGYLSTLNALLMYQQEIVGKIESNPSKQLIKEELQD
jgi:predicted acylesterase/phospholipase RssA